MGPLIAFLAGCGVPPETMLIVASARACFLSRLQLYRILA
jgi:hypothetical protein